MVWIIIGLIFDVAGALLLASLLYVSKEKAEVLAQTFYGSSPPQIQDRLRQSKKAKWGAFLIISGFLLQAVGNIQKQCPGGQ